MMKNVNAFDYFNTYTKNLDDALKYVPPKKIDSIADKLIQAITKEKQIFVCGNGGSASIAEHWTCDHMKGVSKDTTISPKLISLTSNISLMTAIANDLSYAEVFSYQIEKLSFPGDVLIAISSSGNSPNILKAIEKANELGLVSIALVGFTGGKAMGSVHHSIHIPIANYGIVEDCHQIIMHSLAQFIRTSYLIEGSRDVVL
jgi:D-sedoheptulose 7-phosphate isomerase